MPAVKEVEPHVHSYTRKKQSDKHGNIYYRCMDPYCHHYALRADIIGKACLCHCGQEFILTGEDLRRKTPRCAYCSNTAKSKDIRAARLLVEMTINQQTTGTLTGEPIAEYTRDDADSETNPEGHGTDIPGSD